MEEYGTAVGIVAAVLAFAIVVVAFMAEPVPAPSDALATDEETKPMKEEAAAGPASPAATPSKVDPLRLLAFALFAIAAAIALQALSARYELHPMSNLPGMWCIDRLTGRVWTAGAGHWSEIPD